MTHVLDEARGQMREGHTSAQWELIAREKVMRTLLETGEFTADALADLNVPVDYRRHIHGAVTGYFAGSCGHMEYVERRRSERASRKGAKNDVFRITAKGRRELPRLLRDLQTELPRLIKNEEGLAGLGAAAQLNGSGDPASAEGERSTESGEHSSGARVLSLPKSEAAPPPTLAPGTGSPVSSPEDQLLETLCEEFDADLVEESSEPSTLFGGGNSAYDVWEAA